MASRGMLCTARTASRTQTPTRIITIQRLLAENSMMRWITASPRVPGVRVRGRRPGLHGLQRGLELRLGVDEEVRGHHDRFPRCEAGEHLVAVGQARADADLPGLEDARLPLHEGQAA